MKEYLFENFKSLNQFKRTCVKDLQYLVGQKVECRYGSGKVVNIKDSENSNNIIIGIEVNSEIKLFAIFTAVKTNNVILSEEDTKLVNYMAETIETFRAQFIKKERQEQLEREAYRRQLEEEAKKREAEKKLKEKIENRKNSIIQKANDLSNFKLDKVNEYYLSLGYITKHAKKISAVMPEYLDDWFKNNFGDQEHKLVDSTKMTSGGFSYQWSLGMTIELDTNNSIPNYLTSYLGQTKKTIQPISNTEFIFSLMQDSGLTFGKKQDFDKVLENVPDDNIKFFKLGYSL